MNTKKIVLFLLYSCIFTGLFAQSNLTTIQKDFQNEIINFLKEEGYVPSLENETIKFKSEGENHWIRISSESPFFVAFQRAGYTLEGEKGLNRDNSLLACNEVNREMNAAKLYCTDKSVIFTIEQYTRSAEDFKFVFYKNLKILAETEKKFLEKYDALEQNGSEDSK